MHAKRGFTLIELLVVLTIISISFSFALLAFGDFGANRKILLAAEQVSNYLKLLQQQAIIEGKSFGVHIDNKGYQAYRFNTRNQDWQLLTTHRLFQWQALPDKLLIDLQTPLRHKIPNIFINTAGELSTFKLRFISLNHLTLATLVGQPNGQINLLSS